jgi:hypothetical protein
MAAIIHMRRGTAAEWTTANPILADGQQGYETDTGKRKVGDGVTAWTALAYATAEAAAHTHVEGDVTSLVADLALKAPLASPTFTGVPAAPTAAPGTNTTQVGTTAFVQAAIAALVDSSPGALDTLNELAAALGDDANFATTITNALALKAPLASPTFTGTPAAPTAAADTNTTQVATTAYVIGQKGTANPLAPGTAAPGTSAKWTPIDHVHPVIGSPAQIGIAVSDETTAITTGTAKVTFRMPFAMTLTGVRASLKTASSSGNPAIDVNEGGVSIFSTTLTIDATEKTSVTAATPAVISDAALADDAEITVDIDTAGTGAVGLKLWLIGVRA